MEVVLKQDFEPQQPEIYFDNAGRSQQPISVSRVGEEAVRLKSKPWNGLPGSNETDVDELRRLFASIIGSSSSHIAICPSTGFAMTMAAENIGRLQRLSPGQKILLLEKEMASAVYPWQRACDLSGATLCVVPCPDWSAESASWEANVCACLDDSIAVVALPNVHWCDGSKIDLVAIRRCIDARFAMGSRPLFVVDGTQSIGAFPFDVAEVRPDFLACSVHKWLLGPYGTSLVYLPEEHFDWKPLDQHERARMGSNQHYWDEEVPMDDHGYPTEFFEGARRLDSGGRANPILIPMLSQALRLVAKEQSSRVFEQLSAYLSKLVDNLQQFPQYSQIFSVIPASQRGHYTGLCFRDSTMLSRLHEVLSQHHISCSIRGRRLRLSPYIQNTMLQLHRFKAIFFQALQSLSGSSSSAPRTRVLITGACGWLAQAVFHDLLRSVDRYEVFGTYRGSKVPLWILQDHRVEMDISSEESVNAALASVKPHVVIHLAALSSPVECHRDVARAHHINASEALIRAVQQHCPQSLFIFASTDMVYDGEAAPYMHTDAASPVNVYGQSKLAMETHALQSLQRAVVLRLSNMLGPRCMYTPAGVKFLEFLHNSLASRSPIGLKTDEKRSFVLVEDVCRVIAVLLDRHSSVDVQAEWTGNKVYNIGGPASLSRMDLARILCEGRGVPFEISDSEDAARQRMQSSTAEESRPWVVYPWKEVQPSSGAAVDGPKSPRDISMVISQTELELGVTFQPVDSQLATLL